MEGELDRVPVVASQPSARPTQDRVGEGQAIIPSKPRETWENVRNGDFLLQIC
jgi:hypothetical protein